MSLKNNRNRNKKQSNPIKHTDSKSKNVNVDGQDNDSFDEKIEGRNAVLEAIRAGISIDKVFIAKGEMDSALRRVVSAARESGAVVLEADRRKLNSMSITNAHQGVIAFASCEEYVSVGDILENARTKDENALIVICEAITDPHNLGAVIRTCEAVGAHGVIVPKRRSAGLGATVAKTSGGAVYHMPVARVSNIASTITELKKSGLWIFGASCEAGTELWQTDFSIPLALIIGSEGTGISRLVREKCDFHVNIPMFGKISSLNASVSAAVLLYEVVRQRSGG
jgi:23S rRNA (guanosine2251-2'-O)-methyltransferase